MDGRFLSGYSLDNPKLVEDFAEAISAYLSTDGGTTHPAIRELYKHRFDVLDRFFAIPKNQELAKEILATTQKRTGTSLVPVALASGVTAFMILAPSSTNR